ncbi:hypothetical protein BT96DRAFT_624304 [Gymnopus androsaceus JB14]|uniref:Uncharacterized protein n=1 Tax=Gymnopus androsaceus JB14 TaxID=1447944 RepID=A0A6A4IE45_9AGAR|nr:hypothetical protein BT96DRAFT_624304 [Gymnopus androsaceus JB14]
MSPSDGAKNENLILNQTSDCVDAVRAGRPQSLTGPSLGVYHPIFPLFRRRLSEKRELTPKQMRAGHRLCRLGSAYYDDEGKRRRAIAAVVEYFLGPGAMSRTEVWVADNKILPDGNRRTSCGLYDPTTDGYNAVSTLLAELKNGFYGNCDVLDQAHRDYVVISTRPELSELRKVSCIPAFLLAIPGYSFSVSGAIYLDGVISEQLTDTISFVPLQSYENIPEDPASDFRHVQACRSRMYSSL